MLVTNFRLVLDLPKNYRDNNFHIFHIQFPLLLTDININLKKWLGGEEWLLLMNTLLL